MNVTDVLAPENEEGTKATVLKWSKQRGDSVLKDEPLLEIETDKVVVEIPCPENGTLIEILTGPDQEVVPGQVIGRIQSELAAGPVLIEPAAETTKVEPALECAAASARQPLSPSVRRLLAVNGVSPEAISGSGRRGRITAQDVILHVESHPPTEIISEDPPANLGPQRHEGAHVPHSPIRRRIAEHMVRSLATAAHVTTVFETDLSRVLTHRKRHLAEFERQGVRLTMTAYLIAASAKALVAHPQLNATYHEDSLEIHADANVGVGTALGDQGLIVPVIHRAQALNLLGIAEKLGGLVKAARAGRLAPSDVRGGTFTISNHGVGGSLFASPIVINQPQVAILGVGKVERRVGVIDVNGSEAMVIRDMCYITLTIDHRAIDAFQANNFLSAVVSELQQWPQDSAA